MISPTPLRVPEEEHKIERVDPVNADPTEVQPVSVAVAVPLTVKAAVEPAMMYAPVTLKLDDSAKPPPVAIVRGVFTKVSKAPTLRAVPVVAVPALTA
jgi:hypothetical protein